MDKPKVNIKAWQPLEKRKKNRYANTQAESLSQKVVELDEIKKSKQQQMEMRPPLVDSVFTEHVKEDSIYIKPEKVEKNEPKYNIEIETDSKDSKKKSKKQSKMISWFVSSDQQEPPINNKHSNYDKYTIPTPPRNKAKKRISMKINRHLVKTLGAGIGAIATGMLFGYVMLHFVVQPMMNQETTLTPPPADSSSMIGGDGQLMTTGDVIPQQVVYLVQAGVFSDLTGAQATLTNLAKSGKAGAISGNGPFHVFVGMGTDKESAEKLKTVLSSQIPELYVKEYTIPEYRGQMDEETFAAFATWLNSSEPFIQALTDQSVNSIENKEVVLNYEQLQKLHQQFLIQSKTLNDGLEQTGLVNEQKVVQVMIDQVNYAMQAVSAYKKNPNVQYLWKIQEAMMNYKIGYESLTK